MRNLKSIHLCRHYDKQVLGLYVDNELEPDEFYAVEKHLSTCSHCRSVVENFVRLSMVFRQGVDHGVAEISGCLSGERVLFLLDKARRPFWAGLVDLMKAKRNILQLASIAVILLTSVVYYKGDVVLPDGPSAIVNSVGGDVAGVMILETEDSKHTIIWYTES